MLTSQAIDKQKQKPNYWVEQYLRGFQGIEACARGYCNALGIYSEEIMAYQGTWQPAFKVSFISAINLLHEISENTQ